MKQLRNLIVENGLNGVAARGDGKPFNVREYMSRAHLIPNKDGSGFFEGVLSPFLNDSMTDLKGNEFDNAAKALHFDTFTPSHIWGCNGLLIAFSRDF